MTTKKADPPRPRPEHNGRSGESDYDRFRDLTKRLLSVPKKEIEKQAKKSRSA